MHPRPAPLRRLLLPRPRSIGTETTPTYRPGDIRTLDRGKVLVIHRSLRLIRASAVDVSKRPDWKQLCADSAAIRAAANDLAYRLGAGHRPDQPTPQIR